jgi:hypothetical protein
MGGISMRKCVIIGAALALSLVTAPIIPVQAQTAGAKNPMCNIAFKKWSTNWGEYYHCYGKPQPAAQPVRQVREPAKNPMCNIAFKKWSTNWGEYYHCYGNQPQQAVQAVRYVRYPANNRRGQF